MNEVNWNDICFTMFLLVCLGAAAHLPVCMGILMTLLAFLWFIVFPLFILWCINLFFGGEACMVVILLVIGIGIYYFIASKEMNKNK